MIPHDSVAMTRMEVGDLRFWSQVLHRVAAGAACPVRSRAGRFLRRRWKSFALALALAAVIYGVLWVVIPGRFVVVSPGPAPNVADLVEPVDPGLRDESPSAGRLLMTTVLASPATPLELWRAWVDPLFELWPRWALVPEGMDDQTYYDWSLAGMAESQAVAAWQAWVFLGHETGLASDGCRVYHVSPRSPARDAVRAGDLLVGWSLGESRGRVVTPDGFEKDVVEAFVGLSRTSGEPAAVLNLDLRREGAPTLAEVPLGSNDLSWWPFLGLALGAEDPRTDPPVPVTFLPGDIGGPSGGLMLALQIVDDHHPADLTGGRVVAGSGTIGPGGRVGPVGGVGKKIHSAVQAGAGVFLVSEEDYAEALTAAADQGLNDLEVVPVISLREACQALLSLTGQNVAVYNSADFRPPEDPESAWVVGQ